MIVVDSSVWIDYLNDQSLPHTHKLSELLGHEEILVPDLVFSEVLQGMRSRREFVATLELLDSFKFVSTGTRHVAVQTARNVVFLKSVGFTIRKTIDSIIATKCILSGYSLLHNDRDFTPFKEHLGLDIVNY